MASSVSHLPCSLMEPREELRQIEGELGQVIAATISGSAKYY